MKFLFSTLSGWIWIWNAEQDMPGRRASSPWRSETDHYAALRHGAEQEELRSERHCQRYRTYIYSY